MVLSTVPIPSNTAHQRPSDSRPAHWPSLYSRRHGISAYQLFTPHFLKSANRPTMNNTLEMSPYAESLDPMSALRNTMSKILRMIIPSILSCHNMLFTV